MADYTCTKARRTDAASVAACNQFIRRRYKDIYDGALWRDSVFEFPFAWPYDPVADREKFMTNSVLWEYNLNQNLRPSPGLITSEDNTIGLARAGYLLFPDAIDRMLGLRTATAAVRARDMGQYFRSDYNHFGDTGEALEYALLQSVVWMCRPDRVATVSANTDGPDASAATVSVLGTGNALIQKSVTMAADQSFSTFSTGNLREIHSFTREDETTGCNVRVSMKKWTEATSAYVEQETQTVYLLGVGDKVRPHVRIRLFNIPTSNIDLRALVKRRCVELAQPGDLPILRNVESALMAFARHDLLQMHGQDGRAIEALREAEALLVSLQRQEVLQQEHNVRLVPADPFGDELAGFGATTSKGDFP